MGNEQGEKPGSSSWGTGGLLRNDGWAEVWNKREQQIDKGVNM